MCFTNGKYCLVCSSLQCFRGVALFENKGGRCKLLEALGEALPPDNSTQDGFCDGGGEYTSFADQCRQIEEYIGENFVGMAIGDGCCVAHQGKIAGVYHFVSSFSIFVADISFAPLLSA